jgi:polyhydroxyalkanoate synthesis regulator phasin
MPFAKTQDPTKMATEMITLMKSTFTTYVESMMMLHDQSVRILNTFADHGLVTQKEAHKIIREWANNTKKATEEIQKITEDNLNRFSEFIIKKPK